MGAREAVRRSVPAKLSSAVPGLSSKDLVLAVYISFEKKLSVKDRKFWFL